MVRGPCFLAGHLVGTQHTACAPLNSRSTQPLKPEDLCVSPQRPHVRGVSGLWPLEQIPSPSTPFRVTSQMRKLRPGVGGDWHIVTYAARRGLEPGFLTLGSSQAWRKGHRPCREGGAMYLALTNSGGSSLLTGNRTLKVELRSREMARNRKEQGDRAEGQNVLHFRSFSRKSRNAYL